eukprot:NODE_1949_length_1554_cov_38.461915_g1856_i0.p1 GENE.NODE_1949_length_1554_cov_38.461915_g1856_i0~~NODE_1949_length_1554_cov_38.461915_g1856_i0.p1  ORF type:complete len:454 (-),score=79.99 NODE_1949_length_1554_cov_38.461915_g1856_i0:193-1506(-)
MARNYRLNPEEELRFEVGDTEVALLKLTEAPAQTAELFGTELAPKRVYVFPGGSKAAVWTWHGCHLQLEGCSEAYPHKWDADETPMAKYATIHIRLEEMRNRAKTCNGLGPRVLVCGPHDSGKSALCKVLCNYASRQGRRFIFADLDASLNDICSGCVAAVPVEQPISIEDGFSLLPHLAYYVGENEPANNPDLYCQAIENLAKNVKLRASIDGNDEVRHGGVIINTPGFIDKEAYECLVKAIQYFDVNLILVMDDEKLLARLHQSFQPPNPGAQVLNQNGTPLAIEKTMRSGGVVSRNPATRTKIFRNTVKEYFYGSRCEGGHVLRPHLIVIPFDDVSVYKIGGHKVASYLLPAGATSAVAPCQLNKVDPSEALLHVLGGLSHAKEEADVRTSNIAGLVHFQAIDMTSRRFTLLVPSPGALPSRHIVVGTLKWLDT